MKRPTPAALATAVIAGASGVIGSYLAVGATRAFVGSAAGSLLATVIPGGVITTLITEMGNAAATAALTGALLVSTGGYALLVLGAIAAGNRFGPVARPSLLAGGAIWLLTTLATGSPFTSLGAGVPPAITLALAGGERRFVGSDFDPGRRRLGALAAGVLGFGAASYLARDAVDGVDRKPLDLSESERQAVESKLQLASERSLDLQGSTGLVSESGDFYDVDINTVNPKPDPAEWRLDLTGEIENPGSLSYEGLLAKEPDHRFVTLRCVGEFLNGKKLDTALWTGISMDRLIDEAAPTSNCGCVMVHSVDDYYVQFPIDALRRGMLAYGMNGLDLPVVHGRPARILVPGHWGEVSVKWVSEIEFLDREVKGYWEKKGWHGTGPVKTVAKLHQVNHREGDRVQVGGHAYAGYRGISAVQVSTDGGSSWQEATLSEPLPDESTWREWAHEIAVSEPTEVTVRAVEADGTIQPRKDTGPFPNGPSGWVSRTIEPR